MKQFLTIVAVIAATAAIVVAVLNYLPSLTTTIREDFICE